MSGSDDAPIPILKRSQLIKSTRDWSTIEHVSLAVSVATEFQSKVYVERIGDRYRWSLVHPGGPYPLLRITAKYLQVDYQSIFIAFRTVGDCYCALMGDEDDPVEPEAWAILIFDGPTTAEKVGTLIRQSSELTASHLNVP